TNTLASLPPADTIVSWNCGSAFSFTQTGSAFILIAAFFGASPSSETTPLMSPAVAGSTLPPPPAAAAGAPAAGVAAGALDVDELPPPHATAAASVNPRAPTHTLRRRIALSCVKNDCDKPSYL